MTLIIKELIIKGVVSSDHTESDDSFMDSEEIRYFLEVMKNELKQECYEAVLRKLETTTVR